MEKEEERLIGSRITDPIKNVISKIPNNGVTRGLAFTAKVLEANINRNPLTRLYQKTEDTAIEKAAEFGKNRFNIDPLLSSVVVGALIPGPGGEIKATKKLVQTNKYLTNIYTARGSGSPLRATRGKKPFSKIAGVPQKIIDTYPTISNEAMEWARGAYTYARTQALGNNVPLQGYPRFVTPDGKLWKPKTNMKFGQGYSLKFVDTDLLKNYSAARQLKEAPWLKQNVINELQGILNQKGLGDELENLLKIMVSDYDKKLKSLPQGSTKGHFISLKDGGLDIAENFGEQAGKSHNKIVNGQKVKVDGNYAEQAQSTIRNGNGTVPTTWEEYVEHKLPQLGRNLKKVDTSLLKEVIIKKNKPGSISPTKALKTKK